MAVALKVNDAVIAVEVAEFVVGVVAARQHSGSGLAISYFRKLIEVFGVRCGANSKVNNVVKVMCGFGLISKAASHQFSTQKGKGQAARYEDGPAASVCKV